MPLDDLQRTERITIAARFVAVAWAAIQTFTYDPSVPVPAGTRSTALVLATIALAFNLCALVAHRRVTTLRQAQVLAAAGLIFDVLMISSFVWLYTFNPDAVVWTALYVLPLEGALRFRFVGAMATSAGMSVLYGAREVWGADRYGHDLDWNGITFRMGIGALIALVAGLMARDLFRERTRLAQALEQLERADGLRSALVSSLATNDRNPVAIILAEAAAEAVDGTRSRVRQFLPGGGEHCYVWPPDARGDHFDCVVDAVYQDVTVGDISVAKAPGQAVTDKDRQLLAELASHAGLALHNLRLTAELHEKVGELRASRQRIVSAQDRERRRMERDIHDGAQQQLVALSMGLNLAGDLVADDPDEARRLIAQLRADAHEALETLRNLARGLFPRVLTDFGLVPALEAHLTKMGAPPLMCDEELATARFDPQLEAALYFCCLEALQNAAKHAPGAPPSVRLTSVGGSLQFSVSDNGPGFEPSDAHHGSGLRNLADRLEALGGSLDLRSAPGQGTTVAGRVPIVQTTSFAAARGGDRG